MKNNPQKITKAIIAVAGYGTRFLPATKTVPKEMLPIVDKPNVQYLVDELVESGITDIIFVTRAGQSSLEDYFDNNKELENMLSEAGKEDMLEKIVAPTKMANFYYVRQRKHFPYGNATPMLAAKELIEPGESFVYMFGDDLTMAKTPVSKQLIEVFEKHKPSAVLAVQEVPEDEIERYGSVDYDKDSDVPNKIKGLYEKLPKEEAPSLMAQFGRFVFSYDVIERVQKTDTGIGGELWVADVLNGLAKDGKCVVAQPIDGEWLTTGDPLRFLKATFKFAMQRDDIKDELKKFLKEEL